ncbi:MAG: type II toxin-antitoxin system RelE/ParE family toxin [Fimbriimonadaceae bacterium]|nr:type II toxin-antitoxin system RelE/ParE family toxin [Fimbriimonadaceae bacterium]
MDEVQPERLVLLTEAAMLDLASIDNATASNWGDEQANRYTAFLQETLQSLATNPSIGRTIQQYPELMMYLAKIRNRRSAHGHRIVYRQISGGIRIIRILHTAMQWEDHIASTQSN